MCWILNSTIVTQFTRCYFLDLLGNKLTSNDLGRVLDEVLDVSAHWYPLGLQLQVRISTLDGIRIQFQNPRDQLLEMLKSWLTSSDNTSWKTLTDALRSRSVGASQLAGVLETKYCLVEETEVDSGTYDSQLLEINITPPLLSGVLHLNEGKCCEGQNYVSWLNTRLV